MSLESDVDVDDGKRVVGEMIDEKRYSDAKAYLAENPELIEEVRRDKNLS